MGLGVTEFLDDNEDFILNRKPLGQVYINNSQKNEFQKVISTTRNVDNNNLRKSSVMKKQEKAIKTQSLNISSVNKSDIERKQHFNRLDLLPPKCPQMQTCRSEITKRNYQLKHLIRVSLQQVNINDAD